MENSQSDGIAIKFPKLKRSRTHNKFIAGATVNPSINKNLGYVWMQTARHFTPESSTQNPSPCILFQMHVIRPDKKKQANKLLI